MTFDEFVSRGWQDHAADAEGVFARLPEGVALATERRHLAALAALVVHVSGEHLGRWDEGLALLARLEERPFADAASPEGKSLARSRAILLWAAGRRAQAERALAAGRSGPPLPEASDRIRVLATAASALAGQKRMAEAQEAFETAVALADYGPSASDPAARALAVTGNNLSVELENRASLTDAERALMVRAAQAGLRFWSVAGGWMERERAEYRLSQSLLRAGRTAEALEHGRRCLAVVEENGSVAGEVFFAREALALATQALGDHAAARRERDAAAAVLPRVEDASFRSYCEGELTKLDARLASPVPARG